MQVLYMYVYTPVSGVPIVRRKLLHEHPRTHKVITKDQGRRRFLKSGTAIERHRRSARAEGSSREKAREGVIPPLVRGFGGSLPRNFLNLTCP